MAVMNVGGFLDNSNSMPVLIDSNRPFVTQAATDSNDFQGPDEDDEKNDYDEDNDRRPWTKEEDAKVSTRRTVSFLPL
jgi:hypothetical protein